MTGVQLSLDKALSGRDAALETLKLRYPYFLHRARAVAAYIAQEKGTVTADDVREALEIPAHVHHNAMGAVFKDPRFEFTGERVQSAQPQRHANWIAVWRLRDGA